MSEHSKLPWILQDYYIRDNANKPVAKTFFVQSELVKCEANASFIVHACNNYEKLVEALKYAKALLEELGETNSVYQSICRVL